MAVIANGLVIGISSDFIPRLVYRYHYGPCATSNSTNLEWVGNQINRFFSNLFILVQFIGKKCVKSKSLFVDLFKYMALDFSCNEYI